MAKKSRVQHDYKLVWQEDEDNWNTAYGDRFEIVDGWLQFYGSQGILVFSPAVKVIMK